MKKPPFFFFVHPILLSGLAFAPGTDLTRPYTSQGLYPQNTPPPAAGPIKYPIEALGMLVEIIVYLQLFFWFLAVIFGLYAAYLYLFSRGDPEKLKQAKNLLIYTVVSIVLAVVALSLPSLIASFIYGY